MEISQMELIKEQVFLNMRETIVESLLEHGIVTYHEGQAGWWSMSPTGPVWVSIYEVLDGARD